MMTKESIRKEVIFHRKNVNADIKKEKDDTIIRAISKDPVFKKAKSVGIFYPMKDEIDVLKLIDDSKRFLFPKVKKAEIIFYEVNNQTQWQKSKFGVLEPINGVLFEGIIDYLIVPLLAYNEKNMRIGYGKGYYDRYIAVHKPKYTVGVAYDFQRYVFDHESHDQALDVIVSA